MHIFYTLLPGLGGYLKLFELFTGLSLLGCPKDLTSPLRYYNEMVTLFKMNVLA